MSFKVEVQRVTAAAEGYKPLIMDFVSVPRLDETIVIDGDSNWHVVSVWNYDKDLRTVPILIRVKPWNG